MPKVDKALWRDIMEYLRQRHGGICRQWFDDLEPLALDSGLMQIFTANQVHQKYLQSRCLEQFNEAVQTVTGALVAVRFVNEAPGPFMPPASAAGQAQDSTGAAVSSLTPGRTLSRPVEVVVPREPEASSHVQFEQMVINPDYTFDNFVTGPGNHLAYAAAVAVANNPGKAYNPLFIHGGVGLGKTHLLQAICETLTLGRPDFRICFLSCDEFMNQFLECVQLGKMNEFRHRYRHVNLLVIDDIHFLANKERSQEEFFHTFNALHQNGQQIVLSSDSAPAEIPQLEERLVSRFQWGLVAHVSKPCYETRIAIIRAKAKVRGIQIGDDVVTYIATKIDTNARELEGALTTVHGHAALQNKPIDLALAQTALGEANPGGSAEITLQSIINVVTVFYSVKLSDLQSKRRHKSITGPRQVCMWLARKRTRFSLEEIGGYFGGRDHTTVMHSIRTVDDRMKADSNFSNQIERLDEQVSRHLPPPTQSLA